MPLTISDLRQFAGTDRMLLDQRSGTMQSVNKWQRFKSFFDIGDARQRNAETLVAIQHAFLNDTRFIGKSLQAELARLLGEVRTDRAIGVAQVRNILDAMERLADSREGFDARVEAHVAAQGLPDSLRDVEQRVLDYVKQDLFQRRSSPNFDLAARIRSTIEALDAVFSHAGADSDLRDVLSHGAAIDALLQDYDGSPASRQAMLQRVDAFRAPVAHVVARAAGAPDPAAAKRAGLEMLGRLGKPVPPAQIDAAARRGAGYSLLHIAALRPGSTKDDIVRAVLADAATARASVWPADVPAPTDPDIQAALARYSLQNEVMKLPPDVRRNVLDAFESSEGRAAAQYVYIEGGRFIQHQHDVNEIGWICEILQCEAGRPEGYPGGIPHGRKMVSDPSGLHPLALTAYEPGHALSGAAKSMLSKLPGLVAQPGDFDPAGTFHRKVDPAVSAILASSFAAEMKNLATGAGPAAFDGPEARSADVVLPDGSRLPADPAAARDALARIATGRADAAYGSLSPDDRARTNALLALLSPALDDALELGVPIALGKDGVVEVAGDVPPESPRRTRRTIALSGSPAAGFTVNYRLERPVDVIYLGSIHSRMDLQRLAPGTGSFEYEMAFKVDPAALARVPAVDWGSYDGSAATAAMASNGGAPRPDRIAELHDAVPDPFRFDLGVSAGFHFQGEEA